MKTDYSTPLTLMDLFSLNEGVTKTDNGFNFNYTVDGKDDIIPLVNDGVRQTVFQGIRFLYFTYNFSAGADKKTRTEFINELKFSNEPTFIEERSRFIRTAIERMGTAINLASYDILAYPETSSPVLREMIKAIYCWQRPVYGIVTYELIKQLPQRITFDYDGFTQMYLDDIVNGRPRYTQRQKEEVLIRINSMMDKIHNLDYFSIARDVKKNRYKHFIENYLRFASDKDRKVFEGLNNAKILIVDDIVTSGSTLEQILKTIATVRDPRKNNDITLFSLIGKDSITE